MKNLKENLSIHPFSKRGLSTFLATGALIGFIPPFPGTLGALEGIILYYLTSGLSFHFQLLISLLIFLMGVYASSCYAKEKGEEDPDEVVIDEICGAYLSAIGKGALIELLLSFIIFRIIDIGKPFPLKKLERVRSGWGIMLDDVVGGLLTNLVVTFIKRLLF